MEITTQIKAKIAEALLEQRINFDGSDTKYATSLGINPAQYSRIKNGDTEKVLSDPAWISMARRLNVPLTGEKKWMAAVTPVYGYITTQLRHCQQESASGVFCDRADIGKTFTAKAYVAANRNAVYIDCSQVKNKQRMVRLIAKQFGLASNGRYSEVYDDLTFYLRTIMNPLIVLDEAGDLNPDAFLELKALWNACEGFCAWYMMGADGLKQKIDRGITNRKVGFTEIYRRYGSRYQSVAPHEEKERQAFNYEQAKLVITANLPGAVVDIHQLITKTGGSLTRIYTEISKLKRSA